MLSLLEARRQREGDANRPSLGEIVEDDDGGEEEQSSYGSMKEKKGKEAEDYL
jgi:hypothetical protein